MAGRRPKPTALKELEGNPGKRKLNGNEPKYSSAAKCPVELSDRAKKAWKRLYRELTTSGIFKSVDADALAGYCTVYATFVECEELFRRGAGMVIRTQSGNFIQNPLVGIRNVALDKMRMFQIEFGMTPSSRSRLQVEEGAQPDNSLDAFLAGVPTYSGDDEQDHTIN
jgi:P27 family predicted phage terminase small subunit